MSGKIGSGAIGCGSECDLLTERGGGREEEGDTLGRTLSLTAALFRSIYVGRDKTDVCPLRTVIRVRNDLKVSGDVGLV